MAQFKVGDKAILKVSVGECHVSGDLIEAIQDKEAATGWYLANGKANVDWMNRYPEYFEPVEGEKESTSAWLKENKWFIRTGSKEKSKLVQEWLFEHGMEWLYGKTVQSGFNDTMLTNTDCTGEKGNFIMFSTALEKKNAQEIKITFKTIVESVELPVVESKEEAERKKKIQELRETIALAQKQLEEME